MSVHPYDSNSSIYNTLFHPLHKEENKTIAIVTNIALTILTGFLWQVAFWIVNRLDDRKLSKWKEQIGSNSTESIDEIGTKTLGTATQSSVPQIDWKQEIKSTPAFTEANTTKSLVRNYMSLFTHQHQIIDGVYLGDYRAFLSVDPQFLTKHTLVDSKNDTVESLVQCGQIAQFYDEQQPSVSIREAEQYYAQLAADKGCSELGIGLVISATQFQPREEVARDDWSRFQPDLDSLGVERVQVSVDDDDFAWEGIKPHLDGIFQQIDAARADGKKVLIHCVKGASRSATVMIAYLMRTYDVTYDEAFNFVKCQRTQIEAKPSLTSGLRAYQAELGI